MSMLIPYIFDHFGSILAKLRFTAVISPVWVADNAKKDDFVPFYPILTRPAAILTKLKNM